MLEARYHALKCGHSPERWYDPLKNVLDDLLFQTPQIAANAIHQETSEILSPALEEEHLTQLLRSIENHLGILRALMERLDRIVSEVWIAFGRRSQALFGEPAAGKILTLAAELYMHFPRRPEYDKAGIALENRALSVSPESVIGALTTEAQISGPVNLITLPPDLEMLLYQIEPPTAREVAAHFMQLFEGREVMAVGDLLGTTSYDAYMLVRLLEFAASRSLPFPFRVEFTELATNVITLPAEVGNTLISASAVVIRQAE
ncbi:MAG TPA: hypothetical protein PKH77_00675 [Anaerolineae bacterium]|nr:hypothetical protein [Anaerolineae bacterium]